MVVKQTPLVSVTIKISSPICLWWYRTLQFLSSWSVSSMKLLVHTLFPQDIVRSSSSVELCGWGERCAVKGGVQGQASARDPRADRGTQPKWTCWTRRSVPLCRKAAGTSCRRKGSQQERRVSDAEGSEYSCSDCTRHKAQWTRYRISDKEIPHSQ